MNKLLNQLVEIEQFYLGTKYDGAVKELEEAFYADDEKQVAYLMKKFPTKRELITTLIDSLKGKPIFKTLKKISEDETCPVEMLKALFSLGTHVTIECQKGHGEYKALLYDLHERIGMVLYDKGKL